MLTTNLVTNLIAFLSLLSAVLAAWYAHWAWGEARKANEIALHSNRMEIYRALYTLRLMMQADSVGVETSDIMPFLQPSQEACAYFSEKETSQKLTQYFNICFSLAQCTRKLEQPNLSNAQIEKLRNEQDALLQQEEILFQEATRSVEAELLHSLTNEKR
jgi:hypothetical protein